MPQDEWKYVSTKDNPADYGSRDMSAKELIQLFQRWAGHVWLVQENKCWLSVDAVPDTNEKDRKAVHATIVNNDGILERFSPLITLVRVTSYS